ncbi:hypothetical protein OG21DRAFT_316270 [Imleria badia]|nr:hypothetical protein OG21DRAFT_316270 [Imleria badia]
MTPFKFSRLSRKLTPTVATNMSLDAWCQSSPTQSTRLVQRVELCTALAAGQDAWGMPLSKNHHHTLLRVFLAPTRTDPSPNSSADTLLIERVLSTCGEHHSVTPITQTFSTNGSLFHPDVHDRVCVITDGTSTALARHLVVERTLAFSDRPSEPRLCLAQLAQILSLVSRTTKMICDGGDCRFQARAFAFTCLAALAPSVPPKRAGKGVGTRVECGGEVMEDSVFELSAEAFLGQVPWLVGDPASMQTLKLIGEFKDERRERARARLYH